MTTPTVTLIGTKDQLVWAARILREACVPAALIPPGTEAGYIIDRRDRSSNRICADLLAASDTEALGGVIKTAETRTVVLQLMPGRLDAVREAAEQLAAAGAERLRAIEALSDLSEQRRLELESQVQRQLDSLASIRLDLRGLQECIEDAEELESMSKPELYEILEMSRRVLVDVNCALARVDTSRVAQAAAQ